MNERTPRASPAPGSLQLTCAALSHTARILPSVCTSVSSGPTAEDSPRHSLLSPWVLREAAAHWGGCSHTCRQDLQKEAL